MPADTSAHRQGGLVPFLVLTFLITWGVAALLFLFPGPFQAIFGTMTVSNPVFVLAVAAPTISATIITYFRTRWPGLRVLYAGIVKGRFGIQWYAAVLIGLPVIGYVLSRVLGASRKFDLSTPGLVLLFLFRELILGPLGEELGWRGFSLPRLLQRFNPFFASLILGAVWGVWHLPAFFISTLPQGSLALPSFLLDAFGLSVLVTWLYLHTGRSVLIAVLFHLMVNVSVDAFGASFAAFGMVMLVCAVLVVIFDRSLGWFGRRASDVAPASADPVNP